MRRHARPAINSRSGDLLNKMNVTLMMILLAFFIVLNSLAAPSGDKRKAALGSLIGTLGLLPGGPSPMTSTTKRVGRRAAPMVNEKLTLPRLIGEFEEYAIKQKISDSVSVIVTSNGLELTVESGVIFKPGSSVIKPSSSHFVDKVGHVLKKLDGPFVIEGHEGTMGGKPAAVTAGLRLSISRAGAMARWLIANDGVKPGHVMVSGYGPYHPAFPDDTGKHKRRNNRIRFVYKKAI